jgi:GNAT superfamily N-acetyltransferase
MTLTMRIVRARDTEEDLQVVLGLIEDARRWLATKGTDQWANPYPDADRKLARVKERIKRGETWIVWHGNVPAATATIVTKRNIQVWSPEACECDLSDRAVFVHRLITARDYGGLGLGAELIDWAGIRGRNSYGAKWIRIDVWNTNIELHKYYMSTGFERCGTCEHPRYPSGALFQKPVSAIELQDLHIPLVFDGTSAEFVLPDRRPAAPGPADTPPTGAAAWDVLADSEVAVAARTDQTRVDTTREPGLGVFDVT